MNKVICVLTTLLVLGGSASASSGQRDMHARIHVSDVTSAPAAVTPWDATSPQALFRIDGTLYQKDGDFFYGVIDNLVTVRLADGVRDWNDLLQRVLAHSPATFAALETLVPRRQNRLGIIDLEIPHGSPTDWCELLFETGHVRYAEVATYGVYGATPNDPLYPQQWALNNTGQTGGTPGADVDAENAWEITAGDPSIIVAVLDSGTDVDHPDLEANVWINEDEIPNNSTDDDDNGYVDDWIGWDFEFNNNDPNGSFFHGTHVTGIINAVTDNGVGIAGLAGGIDGALGVRGMALGVGSSAPIGSILDDALIYATDNGAHVITMSLSVGPSSSINDALDYAYNQNDVFIDCAAGNNGSSVNYPANRPEVMAVASTTDNDTKSGFSNPGPEVEVAAPGSDILSTQLNGNYGISSGTSFAAPYVAALAALIRSLNPGLPAADVRQLIMDTAEDVGPPGFDTGTGWGRINAFQAVSEAGSSDGAVELDAAVYSCSSLLTIEVADFDLAGSGTLSVTAFSETESAGESVLLEEGNPGFFSGAVSLAAGAPVPDGVLQVGHGETVTVEYVDADDGNGNVNVVKLATASTDCLGPQITDASASDVDNVTAQISWTTDEPGNSVVRYGADLPLDQEVFISGLNTEHTVVLLGLEECTTYRFEIESVDALGNSTVDDNDGAYYTFQTLGEFPGIGVVPCQAGQAELDRDTYGCNSTAQISVTDIDLNTNSEIADTASVLITSTSEPEGEWIPLTEIGPAAGSFEGSTELSTLEPAPDGVLSVASGDLITLAYYDEDDGQGQAQIATSLATVDCDSPAIQGLQVVAISSTRAEIQWSTDEPSTSRVEFGPDASLGSLVEDLELKTSHSLAISAFEACDRLHFRVSSTDELGYEYVADAAGQPFELNLNRIGGLVFHDNFEEDNGWTLEGEWERGSPGGLGASSGDPVSAFSGSGVIGSDLSGSGAFPGDYEPEVVEWAYSPPFDTTGFENLELIFRRKLGLGAGDLARVSIINVLLATVWNSNDAIDDENWIEQRVPIIGLDDSVAVQFAFGIQSGSTGQEYGWNIDEVIVKDSTQPDYLTCGDCAGAPSFSGLSAVLDPAPCAESGLTLQWQPAPAWGTGADGTYEVYRGATSEFVPNDGNRIASGLTATSWTDVGAPLDTAVWYIVRARNNEDCDGGEGLDDGNLVRLGGMETDDQAPASSVGSTVRVGTVADVHVRISWDPAPGAAYYVVQRSLSADFSSAEELGTTGDTWFEDVNAANDEGSYFYRVFAYNVCGEPAP